MTYGFKFVTVTTGATLALLTPVLNVLAGLILFQEEISATSAAGMIMVLIACGGIAVDKTILTR